MPNRKLLAASLILLCIAATPTTAPAPKEFTLEAVAPPFKLSHAKGSFVALHFLLKTECPYCLKHVHTYAMRARELADVMQVFIKPDAPEEIRRWASKIESPQPIIYRDANAALAQAFKIPHGYKFHGQVVHYPALVLLDGEGNEVFRYVGKDNSDRLPFDQFAAKIAELRH